VASIVERWVSALEYEVRSAKGTDDDVKREIHNRLKPLQDLVSGHDFATVIGKYLEGFLNHNDNLTAAAIRWLRAEYGTKTEARQELGVRSIIDDADIYDHLKLLAAFVHMAGYAGLLVCLDEMGILSHHLNNSVARSANFQAILRIVNDCVQGGASKIGFYFAGVDEFVEDRRRGLFSDEALRRRLEKSNLNNAGLKDFSGPVIRLQNLTPAELFVLLHKIRDIFASEDSAKHLVPDDAIEVFMKHCSGRLGANYFQTPSDVVRPFVEFLSILEQNPGTDWRSLLAKTQLARSSDRDQAKGEIASEIQTGTRPQTPQPATGNDLKDFRL